MPTSAMGEIKRKERDRGRTEVRVELETTAKELGYASHEDMVTAIREQRAQRLTSLQTPAPAAADDDFDADPVDPTPTPAADLKAAERPRLTRKLEKANQALIEDRKKLNRARAHEERKAKALQAQLDAQQAEHTLRFAAVQNGITASSDVDFAVHTLRTQLRGKSAEELAKFNEGDYFKTELRKSHPYLYGTETRAAHSSPTPEIANANGGNPPPSDPKERSGGQPDAQLDARKMSADAYAALLRKRGLTPPHVGMPS